MTEILINAILNQNFKLDISIDTISVRIQIDENITDINIPLAYFSVTTDGYMSFIDSSAYTKRNIQSRIIQYIKDNY